MRELGLELRITVKADQENRLQLERRRGRPNDEDFAENTGRQSTLGKGMAGEIRSKRKSKPDHKRCVLLDVAISGSP